MRVLIISHMFPRKYLPHYGIFVFEPLKYLIEKGISLKVLAPLPKTFYFLKFLSSKWKDYYESKNWKVTNAIEIERPTYFQPPKSYKNEKLGASVSLPPIIPAMATGL